jgi:hypothetical protein
VNLSCLRMDITVRRSRRFKHEINPWPADRESSSRPSSFLPEFKLPEFAHRPSYGFTAPKCGTTRDHWAARSSAGDDGAPWSAQPRYGFTVRLYDGHEITTPS